MPFAELLSSDVLVLGGGGILGEAWMTAVLAGLDEAESFDSRSCGCYIGTSAGSVVAAYLAAGLEPRSRLGSRPAQSPSPLTVAEANPSPLRRAFSAGAGLVSSRAGGPLVSVMSSTAGGGELLRRVALGRIPAGRRSLDELGDAVKRTGVDWDGRLRVVALELETGRRVVFGAPGAPQLSVATAVKASCAIPGVFRPIRASNRTYIDGGAWSPTNIDVAEVAPGDRVLCLNPTGSLRPAIGVPAGAIGAISRGIAATEALILKRRGASVTTVNPDASSAAAMGLNLMNARRREAVIQAGLAQGRRLPRHAEQQVA